MRTLFTLLLVFVVLSANAQDRRRLLMSKKAPVVSVSGNPWSVIITNQTTGSGTSVGLSFPAGAVGDLGVFCIKWESATTINYVTNGNNGTMTLAPLTQISHGTVTLKGSTYYQILTDAGANTATANFSGSSSFVDITVYRCRASGTITLDANDSKALNGTSLSFATFTPTTENALVIWQVGPDGSTTHLSPAIGGNAATGTLAVSGASTSGFWYIATSQLSSATITETLGTGRNWVVTGTVFVAQ